MRSLFWSNIDNNLFSSSLVSNNFVLFFFDESALQLHGFSHFISMIIWLKNHPIRIFFLHFFIVAKSHIGIVRYCCIALRTLDVYTVLIGRDYLTGATKKVIRLQNRMLHQWQRKWKDDCQLTIEYHLSQIVACRPPTHIHTGLHTVIWHRLLGQTSSLNASIEYLACVRSFIVLFIALNQLEQLTMASANFNYIHLIFFHLSFFTLELHRSCAMLLYCLGIGLNDARPSLILTYGYIHCFCTLPFQFDNYNTN